MGMGGSPGMLFPGSAVPRECGWVWEVDALPGSAVMVWGE